MLLAKLTFDHGTTDTPPTMRQLACHFALSCLCSCNAAVFITTPPGSPATTLQPGASRSAAVLVSPTAKRETWRTPLWRRAKSTSRWRVMRSQVHPGKMNECFNNSSVWRAGLLWAGDVLHREQHGNHRWGHLRDRLLSGAHASFTLASYQQPC